MRARAAMSGRAGHAPARLRRSASRNRPAAHSAGPSNRALQAKLTVGRQDDPLEREADRAAERVLAGGTVGALGTAGAGAQRKCAACEAEESGTLRRQPIEEEEEEIQPKAETGSTRAGGMMAGGAEAAAATVRSGGRPLSPGSRAYFEPRFGRDLSGVRVHDSSRAAAAAGAIGARAYTLGRDIAFAAGAYAPESRDGRRLLAHELAHVVQQGGGTEPAIRRQNCTLEKGAAAPAGGAQLSPEELERRRRDIGKAVEGARGTYPLAAANLQHWLAGSGSDRRVPQSEFDFTREETGLPGFLREVHRACIAGERELDCGNETVGIQGRLEASHPETLQPPGTERTLSWQDSLSARVTIRKGTSFEMSDPVERDMAIALGGYTVNSRVRLHLEPGRGSGTGAGAGPDAAAEMAAKVDSWQVQICDRYDWLKGAPAAIPIPPDVDVDNLPVPREALSIEENILGTGYSVAKLNDDWFAAVERSGGAKGFAFYSEVFEASDSVKADFAVSNGRVEP